ncbi:reverse transcriptase [Cucumis melo var. makuwa]|uniref:Reverse transcriptase n=1 Tax=Cucumis melo var. makuwa TaxID=1194695 RepID=A0A5D3DBU1_CUCMM|nr:reverse transcriptase [Cucumis melo var. makuwa]TYK20749.1 reverse transcriptase [Cucumis melo var. makuwa]
MDLCRETVWVTSNDGILYAKLEEADRTYDFLGGLNPKFDIVCGHILGQRPLPSLMEVCYEVRLEEDRTNAMSILTTPAIDSTAFNGRSSTHDRGKKHSSNKKQNSRCAYVSEITGTSQSTGPTASQNRPRTLRVIAQSVLTTNQVPWKTYYKRNLKEEIESSASQSTPDQDSEPPQDQGMENPIETCVDNKMSENDRYDVIPENVEEKDIGDKTEVRAKTSNNEAEQGHSRKLDECDPSLDIPIALRKGTKSCTKYSMCNYVFYDNLSLQFRAFTASLDSTVVPKNIHIVSECPQWKNAIMEEMEALKKNKTWRFSLYPRNIKL